MSVEPIIAPIQQVEPPTQVCHAGVERPAPSMEQENLVDNVFTRDQAQLAAVVMGLQTGLALTHYLALETFGHPVREDRTPRLRRARPEEEID